MTTPTRLERNLTGILDDLSAGPTPEYLDDLFMRTGRMRQRPAWTFPERWLPMSDITRSRAFAFAPPWRTIALVLVVIALLAGAAFAYVGSQRRVPAPFGPAANGLIVYDNGGDIYTGDPVTGQERLVVSGKDFDAARGFSPDGTLIAFIRQSGQDGDLYTARSDGTGVKRITTTPIPLDTWIQWTPDSQHFAVIRGVDGHDRLDVLDLNGQARRLAGDFDVQAPMFRPLLAQEILFRGLKDGRAGLFVMNADGSNIRTVIASSKPDTLDLRGATYSPDGKRIFYQSWTPAGIEPQGCCQLWVMDADGSNAHQFPDDRKTNAWEGVPAVSPDGRWVAFWRVTDTRHASVVRADGTGPVTPVGPELSGLVTYTWSPDSSKLLIAPAEDIDVARQYIADPVTGQWTTSEWATRTSPDWQRQAP